MRDRDVSHAVVEMLVGVADQAGLSLPGLCVGLPVDERALRRRLGGLDWDVATKLIDRLETATGPERLRELAARVPDISPFARGLLGRFLRPRLMLGFVFRTVGPSMFPMYRVRFTDVEQPDGSFVAHLSLHLDDGFRDCQTLFDLHGISTAALPTLVGQPPLAVRSITTGRSGDYWFTLPR